MLCGDGGFCAAMVIYVLRWSYFVRRWLFGSAESILCLFSLAAPGPLPLQLMSRGYVQGQLDTLHQFPEYLELIKDDGKPLSVADPGQPQAGTSSEGPVSKRTRYGKKKPKTSKRVVQPEEERREQPDPKEYLRGTGQLQAEPYNLADMGQVLALVEFLALNGGWELFLTPKDGSCLFGSFRRGMELCDEYRSGHLRNQIVLFVVQNHEFFFNLLKTDILIEYGQKRVSKEEYQARVNSEENPLTEEERENYHKPGPFSFYSYLNALLDPSFWGDGIVIQILSRMWQVTITVVGAERLTLTKIRHERPLDQTDFVLVFAGGSHYLGACE